MSQFSKNQLLVCGVYGGVHVGVESAMCGVVVDMMNMANVRDVSGDLAVDRVMCLDVACGVCSCCARENVSICDARENRSGVRSVCDVACGMHENDRPICGCGRKNEIRDVAHDFSCGEFVGNIGHNDGDSSSCGGYRMFEDFKCINSNVYK